MTRTARTTATVLAVGAATLGLSGVASAEDGDHHGHDHDTAGHESGDANPGVLTGVGNLVGGVLNSDLVGNVLDGVF
jgi:hypothetical protein